MICNHLPREFQICFIFQKNKELKIKEEEEKKKKEEEKKKEELVHIWNLEFLSKLSYVLWVLILMFRDICVSQLPPIRTKALKMLEHFCKIIAPEKGCRNQYFVNNIKYLLSSRFNFLYFGGRSQLVRYLFHTVIKYLFCVLTSTGTRRTSCHRNPEKLPCLPRS